MQAVSLDETTEQLVRERNIPKIVITDESGVPQSPDETAVQEAIVPPNVTKIPLYEDEEQAYIPSYQYSQQQENQVKTFNQPTYNQPTPGTTSAPVASTSAAVGSAYNYGWGQAPQAYPASLPNNPTIGNPMAMFDPAALQQLSQQLAPRPVNAQAHSYNSSVGYNMPNGFNAPPAYNPANNGSNWRPGPQVNIEALDIV